MMLFCHLIGALLRGMRRFYNQSQRDKNMFKIPELDSVSAANNGEVLEIEGANGVVSRDENGNAKLQLTLLGSDSSAFKAVQNRQTNKRLAKRQNLKLTAEELEAETIETLAACTVAWHGFNDANGNPVICNKANAAVLYRQFPAIREQADRFINDRTNFLPK